MRKISKFKRLRWKVHRLNRYFLGCLTVILFIAVIAVVISCVFMMYKICTGRDMIGELIQGSMNNANDTTTNGGETELPILERVMNQMEILVGFLSVAFAVLLSAVGILALYLKKKLDILEHLEHLIDSLDSTVLTVVEIVIGSLPRADESQHLPQKTVRSCREIVEILGDNPELSKSLLNDNIRGAKLRLVYALYYFALRAYPVCVRYLKEIIEQGTDDVELRELAYYRLGIAYRQMGQYQESIKCFDYLYRYD